TLTIAHPQTIHTSLHISLSCHHHHRHLHPFPTRRSSDLFRAEPSQLRRLDVRDALDDARARDEPRIAGHHAVDVGPDLDLLGIEDRKSTRLNSSHDQISYAVFCLKKKTNHNYQSQRSLPH